MFSYVFHYYNYFCATPLVLGINKDQWLFVVRASVSVLINGTLGGLTILWTPYLATRDLKLNNKVTGPMSPAVHVHSLHWRQIWWWHEWCPDACSNKCWGKVLYVNSTEVWINMTVVTDSAPRVDILTCNCDCGMAADRLTPVSEPPSPRFIPKRLSNQQTKKQPLLPQYLTQPWHPL